MERNSRHSAKEITSLNVRLGWAQLNVVTVDGPDVQVLIAGDAKSVNEMTVVRKDGTLTIEQPQFGLSLDVTAGKWMQICLRVPDAFLGTMSLSTTVGLLTTDGIRATKLQIETVSGDQRLHSVTAEELLLGTVNGEICGANINGGTLRVRSIGGRINIQGAVFDIVRSSSVTGKQKIVFSKPFLTMEAQSVSGQIHVYAASTELHIVTRGIGAKVNKRNITEKEDAPELRLITVAGRLDVDTALGIPS